MRTLSTRELDNVSGGMMKARANFTPMLLKPPTGGGGGGGTYSGTVNDLYGVVSISSHPSTDYITWGSSSQNTQATTNDRIVVGDKIGTDEYEVELQVPVNSTDAEGLNPDLRLGQWVDIAEGALEVVAGGLGVAAGLSLGIGTDGAAFAGGVLGEEIWFSAGYAAMGIGRIYMAAEQK